MLTCYAQQVLSGMMVRLWRTPLAALQCQDELLDCDSAAHLQPRLHHRYYVGYGHGQQCCLSTAQRWPSDTWSIALPSRDSALFDGRLNSHQGPPGDAGGASERRGLRKLLTGHTAGYPPVCTWVSSAAHWLA